MVGGVYSIFTRGRSSHWITLILQYELQQSTRLTSVCPCYSSVIIKVHWHRLLLLLLDIHIRAGGNTLVLREDSFGITADSTEPQTRWYFTPFHWVLKDKFAVISFSSTKRRPEPAMELCCQGNDIICKYIYSHDSVCDDFCTLNIFFLPASECRSTAQISAW